MYLVLRLFLIITTTRVHLMGFREVFDTIVNQRLICVS